MHRTTRDTLGALLVGGAIAGGLYWLAGHVALALVAGICWGCGLKATFHVGHRYPAYATGDAWADRRWTGLSTGLVTLAATVGVSPTLPVTAELQLGLGFLVIGAGLVAYATGTMAVLERVADDSTAAPSNPGPSASASESS